MTTSFLVNEQNYISVISYLMRNHKIPADLEKIIKKNVMYMYYISYLEQCDEVEQVSFDYIMFVGVNVFNWDTYISNIGNIPMNIIKLYLSTLKDGFISVYNIASILECQNNFLVINFKKLFPNTYCNINWFEILFVLKTDVSYDRLLIFSDSICSYRFPIYIFQLLCTQTVIKFLSEHHKQFFSFKKNNM